MASKQANQAKIWNISIIFTIISGLVLLLSVIQYQLNQVKQNQLDFQEAFLNVLDSLDKIQQSTMGKNNYIQAQNRILEFEKYLSDKFTGPGTRIYEIFHDLKKNHCIAPFENVREQDKDKVMRAMSDLSVQINSSVPVRTFDGHDLSLLWWFRLMKEGSLPKKDLILVHVDSHPDLGVANLTKEEMENLSDETMEKIDIANFILPLAYRGGIKKVVWVKPKWSDQIESGFHEFNLGFDAEGFFAVDSKLSYYGRSDPLVEETKRPFVLEVIELPEFHLDGVRDVLELDENPNSEVIIDIDLDYFSTTNPILSTFYDVFANSDMHKYFTLLIQGDTYCAPSESDDAIWKMESEVESGLNQLIEYLTQYQKKYVDMPFSNFKNKIAGSLIKYWCNGEVAGRKYFKTFFDVISRVEEDQDDLFRSVYNQILPEAIETDDEIQNMAFHLSNLLLSIKKITNKNPSVVTIARSLKDEYTPWTKWEQFERMVIQLLEDVYLRNQSYQKQAQLKKEFNLRSISTE